MHGQRYLKLVYSCTDYQYQNKGSKIGYSFRCEHKIFSANLMWGRKICNYVIHTCYYSKYFYLLFIFFFLSKFFICLAISALIKSLHQAVKGSRPKKNTIISRPYPTLRKKRKYNIFTINYCEFDNKNLQAPNSLNRHKVHFSINSVKLHNNFFLKWFLI